MATPDAMDGSTGTGISGDVSRSASWCLPHVIYAATYRTSASDCYARAAGSERHAGLDGGTARITACRAQRWQDVTPRCARWQANRHATWLPGSPDMRAVTARRCRKKDGIRPLPVACQYAKLRDGDGSAIGRALDCGSGGRGFESRPSPHSRLHGETHLLHRPMAGLRFLMPAIEVRILVEQPRVLIRYRTKKDKRRNALYA